MIFDFKTAGRRVKVEYERGMWFLLRLPLIGDVYWSHLDRWQFSPWSDVKPYLAR